jgi:hypothetical protein
MMYHPMSTSVSGRGLACFLDHSPAFSPRLSKQRFNSITARLPIQVPISIDRLLV